MTLAFLIHNLNSGGAQRQIINLCIGFKNRKYDVFLMTYYPQNFYREIVRENGIKHIQYEKKSRFDLWFVKDIIRDINRYDIQAIIAFQPRSSLVASIAKLFCSNLKLILSERTYEEAVSIFDKRITRLFYYNAQAIVCNSHRQTQVLKSINKKWKTKVHTIYNGFLPPASDGDKRMQRRENCFNVLCVGRIEPVKNVLNIIRAISKVIDHGTTVQVHWAGQYFDNTYPLKKKYKESCDVLIRNKGITDYWKWYGRVGHLKPFYESCDILIHYSFGEGFPNAICEALYHGLPVIASDVCDHPIIIRDDVNGALCDPNQPEELANRIIAFADLPEERKAEFSKNAYQSAVNAFDFDRMVDQYDHLLRTI